MSRASFLFISEIEAAIDAPLVRFRIAAPLIAVMHAEAHILLLRKEAHAGEEAVFRDLRAEAASAAVIVERLVRRIIAESEAAACPSRRWWSRTCSSRRQACSRGPYRSRRLPVCIETAAVRSFGKFSRFPPETVT